jgi:uncharacterized OB-fold protein
VETAVRYLEDGRAVPVPTELSRGFWEAAMRHVLVRPVCADCGRSFFTPQIACPECLSERWSWTPSSGKGHVYSFTVCHRAPTPGLEVPYILAIVDLEEGWSMLSNVEGCSPDDVRIGLEVEVGWKPLADVVLPVFTPVTSK